MHERILDISKREGLSHIGSCLTAVDVMEEIFAVKKPEDVFVLDEGHAGLAYYVMLEREGRGNAEDLLRQHGVHPNRDMEHGIEVSSGSLGLAGAVSLGMALADRSRDVWCLTSDGAMAEGIWWEILRIKADLGVDNLKVFVNANGWSALGPVDVDKLEQRIHAFCPDVQVRRTKVDEPELQGLAGHYFVYKK